MTSPKPEAQQDSDKVLVVGTAGHVDHGKSALVRALTGTDPDRLVEEKARGLTIDLGFAWTRLPGGAVLSFVDVPGHEDFIRNMLAGAGGVDAALLVVAADEGPMPQTREHLSILDLLSIRRGVVALTKSDLVDDDWLALVGEEIAALVAGTSLAGSPIVPVSALTGAGLDALRTALDSLLASNAVAADRGRPRLSIDRAFTLPGFGTVVTGTLRDGTLKAGEIVEVLPGGARCRARSLQSYGRGLDAVRPGRRVAVNLTGIAVSDLERGDVLAQPGTYGPTRLMDVVLRVIPDAGGPLRHDDEVVIFCGAAEIPAHVRVIGSAEVRPGHLDGAAAQLRLARPLVACAGDRFVIRRPSPPRTIGGGRILDPQPRSRWRRHRATTTERFAALARGDPASVTLAMLAQREPCKAADLRPCETGLEPDVRDSALARLAADGRALLIGDLWMTDSGWSALEQRAQVALGHYHKAFPLRGGMPAGELRERLGVGAEAFAAVCARGEAQGWLQRDGASVKATSHGVRFDTKQRQAADDLMARFRADPYRPPSTKEAEAAVGPAVLASLIEFGDLVSVAGDVLFDSLTYEQMRASVIHHLADRGSVTVADVRDQFDTSRKYALALLEHLDRLRVTRRVGDAHVLMSPADAGGDR